MKLINTIRTSQTVRGISQSVFSVSSGFFLVIIIFEALLPGYFTNWFNPIWCLILVGLSGILTIAHKQYD